MRHLLLGIAAVALLGDVAAAESAGPHMTHIPAGYVPGEEGIAGGGPCETVLRYDDRTDDTLDYGPTLGWYSSTEYQYLTVRFTPPDTGSSYEVQSASFFADVWVAPGSVDIHAQEQTNAANQTFESVEVTGAGIWEVVFTTPICVPAGSDYYIMLCPPRGGGWGVCGEDFSAPDNRSYWSLNGPCGPENENSPADFMVWSCVKACGTVSTTGTSWGSIKTEYR